MWSRDGGIGVEGGVETGVVYGVPKYGGPLEKPDIGGRGRRVRPWRVRVWWCHGRSGTHESAQHCQDCINLCVGGLELFFNNNHLHDILCGGFCHLLFHFMLKLCIKFCDRKSLLFYLFVGFGIQSKLLKDIFIPIVTIWDINDCIDGKLNVGVFFIFSLVSLKSSRDGHDQ